LWYSDILRNASPNDRKFLLSVAAALAIYALADNILVYPTALGLFVYLGVIGQPKDASSAIETAATRAAGSAPEADAPAGAGRGVASVRRWTTTPFEALSRDRSRYASHP
jgi:hypothetical protein